MIPWIVGVASVCLKNNLQELSLAHILLSRVNNSALATQLGAVFTMLAHSI
jgi:hypothetical protein